MNPIMRSIAENNVIASCLLVKGPNNKLHLVMPLTDEPLDKIETARIEEVSSTEPPTEHAPKEITEPPNQDSAIPNANGSVLDWTASCEPLGKSGARFYKLVWTRDTRTHIELWDHLDGYGTVHRRMKPRHGKSIKDTPIRNQPIIECLAKIEEWVSEGPYSWTKYDQPNSPDVRKRMLERKRQHKFRNRLFRR